MRKSLKRWIVTGMILVTFGVLVLNTVISMRFGDRIYYLEDIDALDGERVVIVFGAGLRSTGEPSGILAERVMAAADLYKLGKVDKMIMSGDNRFEDYNEPQAMIDLAVSYGVNEKDLQPDYAGRRTYDTCVRAKEVFEVESAILVTQSFHMDRAMYLCESMGIDVIGVASDRFNIKGKNYYKLRDIISLTVAFVDVHVRKPSVVLGDKIEV